MKPEQLTAWALNELSADERAQVEAALSASPQAQASAHEVKAFCDLLTEELGRDDGILRADQRENLRGLVPAASAPALRSLASARQRRLRASTTSAAHDWRQGWAVRVAAMAACAVLVGVVIFRATQTKEQEVAEVVQPAPSSLAAEDVRVSASVTSPKMASSPSKSLEPRHQSPALAQSVVPAPRSLPMPEPVTRSDGMLISAVPSPSAVKTVVEVLAGTTVLPGSGFIETSRLPVAVVNLEVSPIPLTEVQRALKSSDRAGLRVRTSDLINSFAYGYEPPHADEAEPIRVTAAVVAAPWENSHRLMRVAMQARLGTGESVARDVRLEVIFDSTQVKSYRMLGVAPSAANETLAEPQGIEMKAGQAFTALFEIVPATSAQPKDQLLADGVATAATRQGGLPKTKGPASIGNLPAPGTGASRVRMHFQRPDSSSGEVVELLVPSNVGTLEASDADFQFATALAGMGWLLGTLDGKESISWSQVRQWADRGVGGRAERADLLKVLAKAPF